MISHMTIVTLCMCVAHLLTALFLGAVFRSGWGHRRPEDLRLLCWLLGLVVVNVFGVAREIWLLWG